MLLPSTVAHAASLQSWKVTVPLSVGSEFVNVAFSCAVLTRAAFARRDERGLRGRGVSTVKLPDDDDAFPAVSVAVTV